MTAGNHPSRTGTSRNPPAAIFLALLPLLALFPPETRGESMAGCALLAGLLAVLVWRAGVARAAPHALLVTAVALAGLLACRALVPAAAVEPVGIALLAGAIGLAAAWSAGGERLTRRTAVALAAVAVVVALHALYQKFWGLERLIELVRATPGLPDREELLVRLGRGRAFAAFATPAALGGFLALTVPTTVGLALSSRGGKRWLWAAAAVLGAAAFLAAASVTAAAALLAVVLVAAFAWGGSRRGLVCGALALGLVLAGVAWIRGGRVVDRDDFESPWRQRAGNFRAAVTMAVERPWAGVGPGGFQEAYSVHRRPADNETRHAHDLPLELVAEWGWPAGTAIACLFFVLFLQPLWRERYGGAAWRRGLAVGLAAFALQNLADFTACMPSLLWSAALLRGRLACPAVEHARDGASGSARVLAGCSLAFVLVAAATVALGGLADRSRTHARESAFAGGLGSAIESAQRAARLAPWDVDSAVLLARITADASIRAPSDGVLRRLAEERVERAVGLAPVRAAAREVRARLRLSGGDTAGAFADLAEAARLYPAHEEYAASRDRLRNALSHLETGEAR